MQHRHWRDKAQSSQRLSRRLRPRLVTPQSSLGSVRSCSRRRFSATWLLALLWPLLLTGCSPAAESIFEDYHSRLDRLLQLPTQTAHAVVALPALPAIREVQQQLPDLRLDLLDLVAIRQCGLQQLVANRNSSLGKVMTAANQLGYELELLQQLSPCLHHPELSSKLQQQLQQMYQQKQQALPLVLSNLLLTDATLRQQLQGSQRSLSSGAARVSSDTLQALQQLQLLQQQVRLFQQQPQDNPNLSTSWRSEQINQTLALLYQGQLLADLQYSVRYSNTQLKALNQQLAAVDLKQWCSQARVNGQAEILHTVFRQIYLGRVQPYLAELDGLNHSLLPALAALYQHSPFQPVIAARLSQPAAELRQHLTTHVGWWQQLQQQCQLQLRATAAQ